MSNVHDSLGGIEGYIKNTRESAAAQHNEKRVRELLQTVADLKLDLLNATGSLRSAELRIMNLSGLNEVANGQIRRLQDLVDNQADEIRTYDAGINILKNWLGLTS